MKDHWTAAEAREYFKTGRLPKEAHIETQRRRTRQIKTPGPEAAKHECIFQRFSLHYKFPGLNDYTDVCRAHWSLGAKMKKDWSRTVHYEALEAKLQPVKRAKVHFIWQEQNEKRDPDNIVFAKKFILDGLVSAGILAGDSLKHIKGLTDEITVGPRYEVIVEIKEV